MLRDYWVRALALIVLAAAFVMAVIATASEDALGMGAAGVVALVGVGVAVLSLHER